MGKSKAIRLALQLFCALVALAALPTSSSSADITIPSPSSEREYHLKFYHTHTRESIDIVYRKGDAYIPEAISQLEHYLRDHRTGDIRPFDPRLFDLLTDLTAAVKHPDSVINIVCGYRSPWSNAFLRSKSSAVAKNSLHMQAMALDIRIPGVTTSKLRAAAIALNRGGVGYYPASRFVHVDVGPVRYW